VQLTAAAPVEFADPQLKAAVEGALGVPDPTPADMVNLTTLNASGRGITDLTGLEYAVNLSVLWLVDNEIPDVSPLSGLRKLRQLNLTGNSVSDVSPLAELTELSWLDVAANRVTGGASTEPQPAYLFGNPLTCSAHCTSIPAIAEAYPALHIEHDPKPHDCVCQDCNDGPPAEPVVCLVLPISPKVNSGARPTGTLVGANRQYSKSHMHGCMVDAAGAPKLNCSENVLTLQTRGPAEKCCGRASSRYAECSKQAHTC
jgi:hypothetical protein